jgi:RNA polymerase sigma-70 factor, ECF subfamily
MPPDPPVSGIAAVFAFLSRPLDWRCIPTSANGRPAQVDYLREPGSPHYVGLVVDVMHIVDGRIAEINAFVGAHHIAAFGLPPTLDPHDPDPVPRRAIAHAGEPSSMPTPG